MSEEEEVHVQEIIIEDVPAPKPEPTYIVVDSMDAFAAAQELKRETVNVEGYQFTLQQIATGDLAVFLRDAQKRMSEENTTYMPALDLLARSLCKPDGSKLFASEDEAVKFLSKCQPKLVRKLMKAASELNPYSDDEVEAEAKN